MSAPKINVRSKEISKKGWKKAHFAGILAVVVLLGAIAAFAFASFSGSFGENFAPLEITTEGTRQIIRVPAGGNLQEAINRAQSGDIVELQAGASYNQIILPNKPLTDFVTIRSSAYARLPENARVTTQQEKLLAKIVVRRKDASAVSTANGAHHYRFIGIEFAPAINDYVYNLIYFATETDKIADVPHDLEIDRCYVHSIKTGVTRRGLALNSANTVVKNSYFEGFAYPQEETQAICGWTGTKNVKILNNYLEGGAENVMFGGSGPASAELIPTDIEILGNHFNKPADWKDKVSLKCLFELKNAKRVQIIDNYFENNWVGAAFRLTVRSEDGKAPFNTIEDVTIRDNIIDGAGEGINILGKDDFYRANDSRGQILKRLNISNNLFLNIGGAQFAGSGYFLQIADGADITIANNTAFNQGNIVSFYGTLPVNFIFRDNITGHGEYGVHGLENLKSPAAQKLFQNNIFVNNKNIDTAYAAFPPGNFLVSNFENVGFANFAQNDFRLSALSKFKGRAKAGNDIGSNLSFEAIGRIK